MLKLVKVGQISAPNVVQMKDMKPFQVGVVISKGGHKGEVVVRTADMETPEVMSLSDPTEGSCWTGGHSPLLVRLLPPGEKVVVELFNE